jgi:uroporphyrinogen decarboxylase
MADVTSQTSLLIRAARGEVVERPPVWAMRQAGRWDPAFNRVRGNLSFYEFSENVELSAKASLLPRRFDVDGIILFYDITTLAVAMGLRFELRANEGPVPDRPIRTLADVKRLDPEPNVSTFQHIVDLLGCVREELKGQLPVIVFAGAPFTLASYCLGTGKDIAATRRFAQESREVWNELRHRLESATVHFLRNLIANGADLYQLFDSWAGSLEPDEYEEWAQRHHAAIFSSVAGAPRILFVKECPYLDRMTKTGADVISLGIRHDLAAARRQYPDLVFQGNVDEKLLRTGSQEQVAEATRACIRATSGQKHIVNLNHGLNRNTPVANFKAFIRAAKSALEKP